MKLKVTFIYLQWGTRGQGHSTGNKNNGINLTLLKQILLKERLQSLFPCKAQTEIYEA